MGQIFIICAILCLGNTSAISQGTFIMPSPYNPYVLDIAIIDSIYSGKGICNMNIDSKKSMILYSIHIADVKTQIDSTVYGAGELVRVRFIVAEAGLFESARSYRVSAKNTCDPAILRVDTMPTQEIICPIGGSSDIFSNSYCSYISAQIGLVSCSNLNFFRRIAYRLWPGRRERIIGKSKRQPCQESAVYKAMKSYRTSLN